MKRLQKAFRQLLRYPSAMVGIMVILVLMGISIYALLAIPYSEAVQLWRGEEKDWYRTPRQVPPAWMNLFTKKDLPVSFTLSSTDGTATKTVETDAQGLSEVTMTYTFDFPYDEFPQEMALYFKATYAENPPFVSIVWITPDGRETSVANMAIQPAETYRFSLDERLRRILGGKPPVEALFSNPDSDPPVPQEGTYQLMITAYTFEPGSTIDAEFVVHGRLYGLAGTDHMRRDLMVGLLYGTPIALAFGLLAALGTTVTTMAIASFGVWYGGWVDELIQRITEVNLVLPFLPILLMIGTFYSRSIWLMLGATILLSIFGGGIKTYRAVFLQIKEAPYIEAARSYGAGDLRIIFHYLTPRIIPMLIPQLVTLIPTYVFLEASLAVLGLGDPVLPTWGKIINDARANGALYEGLYYWVLEPAVLLMATGLAFALLGFALDRIFNPKLRGV
jgi:peptide/nickel transport system permease protein